MPINAYVGLPRHGKSYEVVQNVILPGLLAGRRVVTNVANLEVEAITAYLVEHHGLDPDKVGTVVQVEHEDVAKPGFFPVERKASDTGPVATSIVQGGDLVVMDEVWRWWAVGQKIDPAHMVFFRMHGHFMHPVTHVTCEVVLITQDVTDLNRALKNVVENTYVMTKLTALGTAKRYRVDIYKKTRLTKAFLQRSLQKAYDPEIFKLYRSHSQGGGESGKEVVIDKRGNIFRGVLFTVVLPLALIAFGIGAYFLWRFFNPAPVKPPVSTVAQTTAAAPRVTAPGAPPVVASSNESDWRVVGYYKFSNNHYVTVMRGGAVRTLVNPTGFYFDALRAYGALEGKKVTNYTGASPVGPALQSATK